MKNGKCILQGRAIKKMVRITWLERAIVDLNSITEYIAPDFGYIANKFAQELIKKADILLPHPETGGSIPENIPGDYRQIVYKSYRYLQIGK